MSDLPTRRQWTPGLRTMAMGIGLAVAAWAPLIIYGIVEEASGRTGGNPIGLGLLAWLGTAVGLVLLIAGAIADSRGR